MGNTLCCSAQQEGIVAGGHQSGQPVTLRNKSPDLFMSNYQQKIGSPFQSGLIDDGQMPVDQLNSNGNRRFYISRKA